MHNTYLPNQTYLLHQVTCRVQASLDEVEVHQAIVQELCCLLEGDCAGLILYDLETQTVAVAAAYCRTQAGLHHSTQTELQAPAEAPVGLTLHLGLELHHPSNRNYHVPWIAQNLETASIPEAERLLLQTAGMHCLLMIPIVYQNNLLGTAYVGQKISCRLWTPDEVSLAKLVAEQAAIALDHARRYSEAQRQAQREQALNCIAQRIRTSLDLNTTINTALTELLKLTKADLMAFAVPSKRNPTTLRITHRIASNVCQLRQKFSQSMRQERLHQLWQEISIDIDTQIDLELCGSDFTQRLLRPDVMVVANTQSNEIAEQGRASFQQRQIGAWLSVSIWYQQKLLGYLIAIKPEPYDWTKDERIALEAVANQLAIAISHRQLYAATQRQVEQAQEQTERLAQTLQQLYATQTQLIQSEKMSGLGQMVAGVAHEINNPINFIYGNIPYIARYTDDLLTLINLYQTHIPDVPDEISDFASNIELEFLKADLLKILSSMRTGTERVREIVLTLRNFSRLDEAEKKSVNLHEGIEGTLRLLKHRLQPHIRVVRHYGKLPPVDSYPRQLNQVFLNVLNNAIDAVSNDDNSIANSTANSTANPQSNSTGQITITTCIVESEQAESRVQIRIRDTGPGISPEHQTKVFDPFFTTKPVGTGTGLGLSVSYRIVVHKHGGRLWFENIAGGTEFVIELPIYQNWGS